VLRVAITPVQPIRLFSKQKPTARNLFKWLRIVPLCAPPKRLAASTARSAWTDGRSIRGIRGIKNKRDDC